MAAASGGQSATSRLTQPERESGRPQGNPTGRPESPQTAEGYGKTRIARRRGSTDKEHRGNSAGGVRKDETGCESDDRNISTAISAQRRPITSIGRVRELSNSSLTACPPPGRPAVAASCLVVPLHRPFRHVAATAATPPMVRKRPPRSPIRAETRAKVNATASWSSTTRTRCPTRPLWPPPARSRTPGGRRHLEHDVCRPEPGVGCRTRSRTLCRESNRWNTPEIAIPCT